MLLHPRKGDKKEMKRICKVIGILFFSLVLLLLALYLCVIAYLKISAASTWEEHRDIQTYGLLEDGRNGIDAFRPDQNAVGDLKISGGIWPERIQDSMDVQDYLFIYYCPWDPNYLGYLVVTYGEEDFEAEKDRLSSYPSTDYIGCYGAEGFEQFDLLAMLHSDSRLVYALTDGVGTIMYVGMQFPGYSMDIPYEKYIPRAYLPVGLDLSKDNPTRQNAMDSRNAEAK